MVQTLTSAQIEVLTGLANGRTVKQIAYERGISRRTVFCHVWSARDRLGAETTIQAVALFVRQQVEEQG